MAMSNHHRKPKFLGGTDDWENISRVPCKKHKAFHLLFNHQTVYRIAEILNEKWIDKDYILIVKRRKRRNEM